MILAVVVVELPVWVVALFAIGVLGTPAAMHMLVVRRLTVVMAALMERSHRRARRESSGPQRLPVHRDREAVPDSWDDDDKTDLHYLIELERKKQQRSRGLRPPRPGTRSDKPYEDDR